MNTQRSTSETATSGASVASLVLGILSFLVFGFLTGIPAIICGHVGRSRIRAAGGNLSGAGMALGGLILGYIASAIGLLVLCLAVLGMVLPRVLPASSEAKAAIARGDIASIGVALKLYRLDNAQYPSNAEGLAALIAKPASISTRRGPYLERQPTDPWQRPYHYCYPGSHNPSGFDLWSVGTDGQGGTPDDIGNWE